MIEGEVMAKNLDKDKDEENLEELIKLAETLNDKLMKKYPIMLGIVSHLKKINKDYKVYKKNSRFDDELV